MVTCRIPSSVRRHLFSSICLGAGGALQADIICVNRLRCSTPPAAAAAASARRRTYRTASWRGGLRTSCALPACRYIPAPNSHAFYCLFGRSDGCAGRCAGCFALAILSAVEVSCGEMFFQHIDLQASTWVASSANEARLLAEAAVAAIVIFPSMLASIALP